MGMLDELVEKISVDIEQKKGNILKSRLTELGLLDEFNKEANEVMRFRNFVCEKSQFTETWWYNDGTNQGLRIITFDATPNFTSFESNDYSTSFSFRYY